MKKGVFLVVLIATAGLVSAQSVVINEFCAKGTEWVELYNPTGSDVLMGAWYAEDDGGTDNSISGDTVPAGGYYTWNTSLSLSNAGDYIVLKNDVGAVIDSVAYGRVGGCPISPYIAGTGDPSSSRAPNGADTDDHAADWTIDRSPTPGIANDAPAPGLGASLIINEIVIYPHGSAVYDSIEIYNPTGAAISLTGWWMTDTDQIIDFTATSGNVPAGGYKVLVEGEGDWPDGDCDFAGSDVAHIFNPSNVRVDQLGWENEPSTDYTFQRVPDGAGPHDGYDWISSGGGVTLFDTTETWGGQNVPVELASFSANATRHLVELTWETGSETDNLGFNIYRSDESRPERSIINSEIIPGAGTTMEPRSYSFMDIDIAAGATYRYWLEQVDFQGTTEMFGPVTVSIPEALPAELSLAVSPLPVEERAEIRLNLPMDCVVSVGLYDLQGREVTKVWSGEAMAGSYSLAWGRGDLSSGMYMLHVTTPHGNMTKRMILR